MPGQRPGPTLVDKPALAEDMLRRSVPLVRRCRRLRSRLTVYTLVVYLLGAMGEETEGSEFDWDGGNAEKNWLRHRISQAECEQVFFNRPLVVAEDIEHSDTEDRFLALGQTDAGRLLFVVYVLRGDKVRVVSARDMTRREQKEYEDARTQQLETNPEV
jgi:uncharacterized protein